MGKRIMNVLMVLMIIFQSVVPSSSVFAERENNPYLENEAVTYRITHQLSNDRKTATVHLELKANENVTVNKIIFPNGEVQTFAESIKYQTSKNGELIFKIEYRLDNTKKVADIFYNISDISAVDTQKHTTSGAALFNNEIIARSEMEAQDRNAEDERETNPNNMPETLLTIASPTEQSYYGDNHITSNIKINGSGLKEMVRSVILEVALPTSVYKGTSPTTQSFIDSLDISAIPGFTSLPKIKEEKGKTVIELEILKIDNTTQLTIPYTFSFTDRLTPDGYALRPKITLYQGDEVLSQIYDKEYKIKYDRRKATKNILNNIKGYAFAGSTKGNDNNRISETQVNPVTFVFGLEYGEIKHYRQLASIVIKDILPTYINSQGETVTAKFDPKLNPGWTDHKDGTVSTTVRFAPPNFSDLRFDIHQNLSAVQLNLLFPDAPIKENGKDIEYTNRISILEKPYNQTENENVIDEASTTFYLKAETYDGKGMLRKYPRGGYIQYDQFSLYAERPTYRFALTNKYSTPLTALTIIEDEKAFDSRLFLNELVYLHINKNGREQSLNSPVKIRAYRKDGSYVDWPFKNYLKVNESAEAELLKTAEKVNNGTLNANDSEPVSPEFVKVAFVFEEGFALQPGETLSGEVKMAFKDPYHVARTGQGIENVISIDAKTISPNEESIPIRLSAKGAHQFIDVNEKVSLSKWTEGQKTGQVGENVSFIISLRTSDLLKRRYLKNPTFIDVLPKGVSVSKNTIVKPFYNSPKYLDDWEIIENYHNTGRTAIKVRFKSGSIYDLKGGDINVPYSLNFSISNLKINDDIIPTLAETKTVNNDNTVYFFTDDQEAYPQEVRSDNLVTDRFDINQNGRTDDKILGATSKVLGTKAEGLYSNKSIRSLESVEGNDELNDASEWMEHIRTAYSGKTETGGRFQYQLQINNYTKENKKSMILYDVLPYKGDNLGSQFNNEFMGNLVITAGDEDITEQFDVYYRTDQYPSIYAVEEINNSNWTKTPSSFKDITAVKAVMKANAHIKPYTILKMTWDMIAPNYDSVGDLEEQEARNAFYVSYNGGESFEKSNIVKNTLLGKWTPLVPPLREIEVSKDWQNSKGEAEKAPVEKVEIALYKDGEATGERLELNAANHWRGAFKELEIADSVGSTNNYNYTIKEVGENDHSIMIAGKRYKVTYEGNMREGFKVVNQAEQPWTPLVPPLREIEVSKDWQNSKGEAEKAPVEKVEIALYKDGEATGERLELNAANHWRGAFKELEIADSVGSTNNYNYTIKEVGENDHSIMIAGKRYKVTYEGNMQEGFRIVNQREESEKPNVPIENPKASPKSKNNKPSSNLPKTGSKPSSVLFSLSLGGIGLGFILFGRRRRDGKEGL